MYIITFLKRLQPFFPQNVLLLHPLHVALFSSHLSPADQYFYIIFKLLIFKNTWYNSFYFYGTFQKIILQFS